MCTVNDEAELPEHVRGNRIHWDALVAEYVGPGERAWARQGVDRTVQGPTPVNLPVEHRKTLGTAPWRWPWPRVAPGGERHVNALQSRHSR